MAYNAGIPNAGDLISSSQQQIKDNFTAIDSASTGFSVDHVSLTDNTNGGKHNRITLRQQGSDQTTAITEASVYTKSLTTNGVAQPELYLRQQSNGTAFLMTRGSPVASSGQGVAYGGMMIRCGSGSGPGSNIAVSISPAFPTACSVAFVISNNNSRTWNTSGLSTSGFTANASSSLAPGDVFFWLAIGY